MFMHIPELLSEDEVRDLTECLAKEDFVEGRATAGAMASRIKNNLQLSPESPHREELERMVVGALIRNEQVQRFAFPRYVFGLLFSTYQPGAQYGTHVDNALMRGLPNAHRTDLSVTVFLSSPDSYEGGELMMEGRAGTAKLKLAAGDAVLYSTSELHRVAEVTRGERLAAVGWIQSHLRDPAQRELLYDLSKVRTSLESEALDSSEALLLSKVYANLLRMWAEA